MTLIEKVIKKIVNTKRKEGYDFLVDFSTATCIDFAVLRKQEVIHTVYIFPNDDLLKDKTKDIFDSIEKYGN